MIDRRFMRLSGLIRLAAVVTLSACSTTPASLSKPTKYPVYEMSSAMVRPVFPTGDQNLAWLDDERVLFEGLDRKLRDPVETNQGVHVAMRGLYIWNIRTNEVIRYTREPLRSFLCYSDDYVSYSVYRDGKVVRLEGPFGQEQAVNAPLSERRLNPFTCRSYERSSLPKPIKGGGIEPLRTEHGWLEHAANSSWLRTPDEKFVQLRHAGKTVGLVMPQKFSAFSKKYVFWRGSPDMTWLLEPDGTLHREPEFADMPNGGRVEPAAGGSRLFRAAGLNVRANWDPGASGLYLQLPAGGAPQRLVTGLINAMNIHRRGCLVAMIVDPWNREGREHELKVVNVCR
jgi:hypothetical protein